MRLEFKEQRDRDFLASYDSVIKKYGKKAPFLKRDELLLEAITCPAKRFYVSEEQSFRIITKMLKGQSIGIRNPLKLQMYKEIFLRVKQELEGSSLPIVEIIENVINQSAPRFYIDLKSARILHYKLLNKRRWNT